MKDARSCLSKPISSALVSWGSFEILGGVRLAESSGRLCISCTDTLSSNGFESGFKVVLFALRQPFNTVGRLSFNLEPACKLDFLINVDLKTYAFCLPFSLLCGLLLGGFEVKSSSSSSSLSLTIWKVFFVFALLFDSSW